VTGEVELTGILTLPLVIREVEPTGILTVPLVIGEVELTSILTVPMVTGKSRANPYTDSTIGDRRGGANRYTDIATGDKRGGANRYTDSAIGNRRGGTNTGPLASKTNGPHSYKQEKLGVRKQSHAENSGRSRSRNDQREGRNQGRPRKSIGDRGNHKICECRVGTNGPLTFMATRDKQQIGLAWGIHPRTGHEVS
jgi:hypothetical protein